MLPKTFQHIQLHIHKYLVHINIFSKNNMLLSIQGKENLYYDN